MLVFSQFTRMLALLSEGMRERGIRHVALTGSTVHRQRPIDEFSEGKVDVFLISLKAGGTGLNLTSADTVIHYDPWWNPAAQAQATDRAYRIGQTRPVFVYSLIVAGSVEERMLALAAAQTKPRRGHHRLAARRAAHLVGRPRSALSAAGWHWGALAISRFSRAEGNSCGRPRVDPGRLAERASKVRWHCAGSPGGFSGSHVCSRRSSARGRQGPAHRCAMRGECPSNAPPPVLPIRDARIEGTSAALLP